MFLRKRRILNQFTNRQFQKSKVLNLVHSSVSLIAFVLSQIVLLLTDSSTRCCYMRMAPSQEVAISVLNLFYQSLLETFPGKLKTRSIQSSKRVLANTG